MREHVAAPAGLLALVLVGACAAGYPTVPEATPSPFATNGFASPSAAGTPAPAPTATPGGPPAEIEILLIGGPYSGSYRAVADGACDSRPEENRFTVTYAAEPAASDFVTFELVIRDAALAQEDETDDFALQMGLGGAVQGISYSLDPVAGQGVGMALLEISPTGALIDLSGEASDGVQVELTVICGSP